MSNRNLRDEAKFSPYANKPGLPVELKAVSQDAAEFSGYASVFGVEDSHRDVVMPGAFDKTVEEFNTGQRAVVMLYQHDWLNCIGHYTEMSVDDIGLLVKGVLHVEAEAANPLAQRAWYQIKTGILKGLSIGFRRMLGAWDEVEMNWKIFEADVFEISPVWLGSNPSAVISKAAAKLHHGLMIEDKDLHEALTELGFSQEAARGIAAQGITGFRASEGLGDDTFNSVMERLQNL